MALTWKKTKSKFVPEYSVRELSYFSENPGMGLILLGAFICVIAIGFTPFGMSVFGIGDFSVEGGPEGLISGPLFTMGLVLMVIGAYIQVKG